MARVALVTGGTRGIGHAISIALKSAGYRVAASYAGNDAAAQQFQAETGIPVYKFDVASFDRADEPRDVKLREGSSLEWGTTNALSRHKGIPDAVFDRGGDGKEPIVRILGRNPAEVADKVLRVSKALHKSRS